MEAGEGSAVKAYDRRLALKFVFPPLIAYCFIYGLFSIEYTAIWSYSNAPQMWTKVLGAFTSHGYAYGPGSVFHDSYETYLGRLPWIAIHTICNGLALIIGPFQFIRQIRDRWIHVHRWTGRSYLTLQAISLIAIIIYLASTPTKHYYSGSGFAFPLWGLWALTVVSGVLAYIAVRRGDIRQHMSWMALNFGMMQSAPGLRVLWIVGGWICPSCSNAFINTIVASFLLPYLMIFASLFLCFRENAPEGVRAVHGLNRTISPVGFRVLLAVGVAGTYVILNQYIMRFFYGGWFDLFNPGKWAPAEEYTMLVDLNVQGLWALSILLTIGWGAAMLAGPVLLYSALKGTEVHHTGYNSFSKVAVIYYAGVFLGGVGQIGWQSMVWHTVYGSYGVAFWVSVVVPWWITSAMAAYMWRTDSPRHLEWLVTSMSITFAHATYLAVMFLFAASSLSFYDAYTGTTTLGFGLAVFLGYSYNVSTRYNEKGVQPIAVNDLFSFLTRTTSASSSSQSASDSSTLLDSSSPPTPGATPYSAELSDSENAQAFEKVPVAASGSSSSSSIEETPVV